VLHRKGDSDSRSAEGRYIAEHIPGARFVELPGDDHVPWIDPDRMLEEMQEFLTGTRPVPEPDRVLMTLLFTDIVGSTRRASELGDRRWRELLDAHHALVRSELDRFRGREVDTAGDGFFATFDGPARAVRAACAIRDGVRALGLEIRAGVHTAECELAGESVRGIAVHAAARVAAEAGAGQVLASSTVRDLVAGSGIEFEDRGTVELRGVGKWPLFEAVRASS
jgi:class 3 adenylate cyclase